jgi:hypothetical protein
MTDKALTNFMTKKSMPTISKEQQAQALQKTVDEAGGVSQAGLIFLGFSGRQGTYSLGRDKADVDEDTLFIVEPLATIAGWTCWKESKPISKHKWLSTDAARNPEVIVYEDDLEDHAPYRKNSGDGWKPMLGIGLLDINDLGTSIEYSSTAVSAINGLKDVIQEAAYRLMKDEPEMPIITLGREEFTAQGSTNWKPTFNVETWVTREAVAAFAEERLTIVGLLKGQKPRARKAAKKKDS